MIIQTPRSVLLCAKRIYPIFFLSKSKIAVLDDWMFGPAADSSPKD